MTLIIIPFSISTYNRMFLKENLLIRILKQKFLLLIINSFVKFINRIFIQKSFYKAAVNYFLEITFPTTDSRRVNIYGCIF
jgi:hypothetical protein